jgi:hypothetical protein
VVPVLDDALKQLAKCGIFLSDWLIDNFDARAF